MFARWRQENFFKYMGDHHGLDTLVSYGAEDADPEMLVTNPERKRLDREIAELRAKAAKIKAELGKALLDEPRGKSKTAHGLKVARGGAVRRLRIIESQIDGLTQCRKPMPAKVPLRKVRQASRNIAPRAQGHRRPHQDHRLQRRGVVVGATDQSLPQPS